METIAREGIGWWIVIIGIYLFLVGLPILICYD